jgi:hypothetical protein
LRRPSNSNSSSSFTCRRSSATTTAIQQKPLLKTTSWITLVKKRPVEYASIPCVAAFVGISTNWMGVKVSFTEERYYNMISSLYIASFRFISHAQSTIDAFLSY